MDQGTLELKILAFEALKDEKREYEERARELKAELEVREREIITDMCDMAEAAGLSNIGGFSVVVDGRSYKIARKTHYSIRAGDRETAFQMMRKVGLGSLIVERVDDRTLSNALNELKEQNGGELAEEYKGLPVQAYDEDKLTGRKVGR